MTFDLSVFRTRKEGTFYFSSITLLVYIIIRESSPTTADVECLLASRRSSGGGCVVVGGATSEFGTSSSVSTQPKYQQQQIAVTGSSKKKRKLKSKEDEKKQPHSPSSCCTSTTSTISPSQHIPATGPSHRGQRRIILATNRAVTSSTATNASAVQQSGAGGSQRRKSTSSQQQQPNSSVANSSDPVGRDTDRASEDYLDRQHDDTSRPSTSRRNQPNQSSNSNSSSGTQNIGSPTHQQAEPPESESPHQRSMLMKILTCDCNFMGQNHSGSVGTEKKPVSQQQTQDNLDRPSYEVVYSWSQSFDQLMKNRIGQKYFAEFLKGEYSDENILFWQACEELKREKNAEKIEEKARIIYEDFISILSPKEVSLDSRVREIVNSNMSRPSASTFDEAQAQIYTLMQRDSYPRFLASPLYKNMIGNHGMLEEV